MATQLPKIKYRGRNYVVDFRLGEMRNLRTAKPLKFTQIKAGVKSPIKSKLRGLRFRTWHSEYIGGLDD